MHDDLDTDELSTEFDPSTEFDDADVAVTTLERDVPNEAESEWNGPRCEKCEAPLKSDVVTICRNCGWYASLGTFVEVDKSYEIFAEDAPVAAREPQKSHLRVWLDLLPRWSWVVIASCMAVIVESIVVRLATPSEIGGLRTAWSLTQLMVGVLGFICCHIFNFMVLAANDSDFGVLDLLLKPVKLWMRAVQELPTRLWVSNLAACSIVAAVMSLVVIGAIPYERFWDWGFEEPTKQDLLGAVANRVRKLDNGNGADNLEDAVGDLAGTADGLTGFEPPPPKPRHKADCVILGYQTDNDGRLDSLVLGTNYLGKLVFAGRVTPKMSGPELSKFFKSLERAKTHQPLINIQSDSATWVKPQFTCRVTYTEREKGRLLEIEWGRLLSGIKTK